MTKFNCWHRTNLSYQTSTPQVFLAHDDPPTLVDWFLDSGASTHLTSDASQMQYMQPYAGNSQVQVGNGTQLPIAHLGQGILPTPAHKLQLSHLLHVSHLTHNFLSVHRLIKDNNFCIIFHSNGFTIKDSRTHQPLLRGTRRHGLYLIELPVAASSASPASYPTSLLTVSTNAFVWHRRLGHPAADVLHVVSSSLSLQKHSFHCDFCAGA